MVHSKKRRNNLVIESDSEDSDDGKDLGELLRSFRKERNNKNKKQKTSFMEQWRANELAKTQPDYDSEDDIPLTECFAIRDQQHKDWPDSKRKIAQALDQDEDCPVCDAGGLNTCQCGL